MVAWSEELSEYDIRYEPREPIKAQALADFPAGLVNEGESEKTTEGVWILSVDGSSNQKGSGAEITLEGPDGILREQSLQFGWKARNNQAEYEALVAGMNLAAEVGAQNLKVRSDSPLVTGQVMGAFAGKEETLLKYLEKVQKLKASFKMFELTHVPREQNNRADILSKLANTKMPGNNRTVIQETIPRPTIEEAQILVVEATDNSWMTKVI